MHIFINYGFYKLIRNSGFTFTEAQEHSFHSTMLTMLSCHKKMSKPNIKYSNNKFVANGIVSGNCLAAALPAKTNEPFMRGSI